MMDITLQIEQILPYLLVGGLLGNLINSVGSMFGGGGANTYGAMPSMAQHHGMFGSMFQTLPFLGPIIGRGEQQLTSTIGNKLFGTPDWQKTPMQVAEENAKASKAAMDIMFPKTTAWERLGGGSGGAAQMMTGNIAADTKKLEILNNRYMQDRQIRSNERIARIGAGASMYGADQASGNFQPLENTKADWDRMSSFFNQKIDHWKSESGKIDLAIYRSTMDQVLDVTKKELTARGVTSQEAWHKLQTVIEGVKQAKSESEIKKVTAEYIEYAQWANIGKDGASAILSILGAGAGARFSLKGFEGLSGKGIGGGKSGFFNSFPKSNLPGGKKFGGDPGMRF